MSLRHELRARAQIITSELKKDAGAARIATIELHYAIEALQQAAEKHGWPVDAGELCEMTLTIHSAIVEIVEALFDLAGKTQRLAAIADLAEPAQGGNSV